MVKFKNLILIGSSHIAQESVKEVEEVLLKHKPKIIALELDQVRFHKLMNKNSKKKLRKDRVKKCNVT